MTDLRVGLIGYGLGGEAFHAPLIATTPGLRLSTIVTANAERARRAASRYAGVRIVESVERLWEAAREHELIVVASPNPLHVPHARAALEAGCAVVVDKPLAPSAEEARALAGEARARGLLLSVYQNRRWDGDLLTVERLLREGALGRVIRFESRFERWRPQPRSGWRESADPRDAGGILFDLGSHLIDQALHLFGPATHVYAELERVRPGVAVEDDAFVALTHASGVRSHLWTSAAAAQAGARLRVLGTAGAYTKHGLDVQEEALRAGATPGGADWGVEPPERWGVLGAGDELRQVPTERGDYPAFYGTIATALRDGGPPPVDPLDAAAALDVIEAARRSSAQTRVIELPTSAPSR